MIVMGGHMEDWIACEECALVFLYDTERGKTACPECAAREAERRRAREAVGT